MGGSHRTPGTDLEELREREARPSVQEMLDRERHPVPEILREQRPRAVDLDHVDTDVFTSRAWHDLEIERMWDRVWQMACREEEIPNVGDHVLYEIGPHSLIVVRCGPDEIRALHNSCLHRGTQLRTQGGTASALKCPFHGWTWNLDGSLREIPSRWDFPHVDDERCRLPEARVGRWGGFVFVNLDSSCAPLEEYLAPIPDHFAPYAFEKRVQVAHVQKTIRANWKVVVAAFIESYHVRATHPQIMPYLADTNTQYDVYGDHTDRMISMMLVPSPHVAAATSEQDTLDAMIGAGSLQVPEGRTARETLGDLMRTAQAASDPAAAQATDSELMDAIEYFAFPNFCPWAGFQRNIIYRFLPAGDDPETSIMEIRVLAAVPEGESQAPATLRRLGPDDDFTGVEELGGLCPIFNQDMGNLPRVQRGLRASRTGRITLARSQESRIRHLHQTLDRYVEGD